VRLRFAEFVFDSDTRVLCRADAVMPLTPKAFQLLELLLRERPKAVSKTQIITDLWPQTYVTEANVTNLVSEIRDAIGDDRAAPRFIRTVHRFGYAFCGTATAAPPLRMEVGVRVGVRLVGREREFVLHEGDTLVGRGPDCDVRIESSTVSRHQARLRLSEREVTIEDLGSKNGTFVRGERLEAARTLADGDDVRFGGVRMKVRVFHNSTTEGLPLRRRRLQRG
jgi:hypothetical protein